MKYFNATLRIKQEPIPFREVTNYNLFVVQALFGFGQIKMYPIVYMKISDEKGRSLESDEIAVNSDTLVYPAFFRGINSEIQV